MKDKYKNVKEIDLNLYDEDLKEHINSYNEDTYKLCKVCGNYYPMNKYFFMKEKRISDGYENKCRLCRKGKWLNLEYESKTYNINNNKSVIENFENYLSTNCNMCYPKDFVVSNYKEIVMYLIEDKYNMTDEQIYNVNRDWFVSHKMYGLLLKKFNGIITDLIISVYGDKYVPWMFTTAGEVFYKEQGNIDYMFNWFINKLHEDNYISSIEDIPSVINYDLFKKYKCSYLCGYKGGLYNLFNYYYSNTFESYQFNMDRKDMTKDVARSWLKHYAYKILRLNDSQIPRVLSYMYLHNCKNGYGRTILGNTLYENKLYDNFNDYIIDTFDNIDVDLLNNNYKNHYHTLDNQIVKSEEERIIHHIFMNSDLDFYNCSEYNNNHKFYDSVSNRNFVPDWIIKHGGKKIIVEFYGMMSSDRYGDWSEDIGYKDKYINKDKYYNRLCNEDGSYIYISLFMDDIKHKRKGLYDKFNNLGIKLDIDTL